MFLKKSLLAAVTACSLFVANSSIAEYIYIVNAPGLVASAAQGEPPPEDPPGPIDPDAGTKGAGIVAVGQTVANAVQNFYTLSGGIEPASILDLVNAGLLTVEDVTAEGVAQVQYSQAGSIVLVEISDNTNYEICSAINDIAGLDADPGTPGTQNVAVDGGDFAAMYVNTPGTFACFEVNGFTDQSGLLHKTILSP